MPRLCTVCTHDDRAAIDEAIVTGIPGRAIAGRYSVSRTAVQRHARGHVAPSVVAVRARREARGAETLVDRVEALYGRASAILDAAETEGRSTVALAAVRELRGIVETLGKLTGELDTRPTVNVLNLVQSEDWQIVRGEVLAALVDYPEARAHVADRLMRLELVPS